MTTYSWTFSVLYCDTEKAGQEDVVYQVLYSYRGVESAGYTASVPGTARCDYESGDPFIPLADLQPSDVEGWVTTSLGPDGIEALAAEVDILIADQMAPKQIVVTEMPWL